MSAILVLETGHIFSGISVGVPGVNVGELIFNTSMTGYQEIISDPSYAQQIIIFTAPHIGNTGINSQDHQSSYCHAAGIVLRNFSKCFSNWRADYSLSQYLYDQNLIAIANIDTRSLTKLVRAQVALKACIMAGELDASHALNLAKNFSGLSGLNLTSMVSTKNKYTLKTSESPHVVLIDCGVKQNIIDSLLCFKCKLTIVPLDTSVNEIMALNPDGIILSNGPGDPRDCIDIISKIKIFIQTRLPLLGICLGHQLLALAFGAQTYKMPFGHHAANHPVQNVHSKKVIITSQNHSFAVKESSLNSEILEVTHRSLLDQSIQGFRHKILPIFGFQGHPEAGPGPHDGLGLLADFINVVRISNAKAK